MKDWNDPNIDWKNSHVVDECEFGYKGMCEDCGVIRGEPHFPGWDIERCKKCGSQKITCDCLQQIKEGE